jgi:hypothetical protein
MNDSTTPRIREAYHQIYEILRDKYLLRIDDYVYQNQMDLSTVTGFLIEPETIIVYIGRTHLAIEFMGPERINELHPSAAIDFRFMDLTSPDISFMEEIIGFAFDGTVDINFELPCFCEDLILPTNKGHDKLVELGWNFAAQSMVLGFNIRALSVPENKHVRLINSFFFDSNDNGLITRHIKWIDFIPLNIIKDEDEVKELAIHFEIYRDELIENDAKYIYPMPDKEDYKYAKLPIINRFIELAGNKTTSEPTITKFLSSQENQFILSMAFLARSVHYQLSCEWQSEEKNALEPDFFVVHPNGYADIVEFKLPDLKSSTITGRANRETFSAEINSYISQTRVYSAYFDDPNNRKWFEGKYGFKVHHPKRILVVGRRSDFSNEEWREIVADYRDIEIITYDDLVSGITAQFYM